MRECVVIPTTADRNHYLYCALKRIRAQDSKLDIAVFLDRSCGGNAEALAVVGEFGAALYYVGLHDFYGNSFAAMTAYSWAYEQEYDLVHYNESDTMQHPDCLDWHREQHEMFPSIFASCGWVFNQKSPLLPDVMFAPWIYAPNFGIARDKLALVVKHSVPEYFENPRDYVLKTWPNSILHSRGTQENTAFFEQDAVLQYVLMEHRLQVAWRGTALVDHVGASGYNRPKGLVFEGTLDERVTKVESLIADPHTRAEIFGRSIVEREIGRVLPKRERVYTISLPGGWRSEFVSELKPGMLPKVINSVRIADYEGAVITSVLRDAQEGDTLPSTKDLAQGLGG